MSAEISLPRLYERDIDVLLQEELIFSQSVCDRIGTALGFKAPLLVNQCALSVVDATGETDLLARFTLEDGQPGILLIENKIDANFQPSQPERYRARAMELALKGARAYCLLVAPKNYADGATEAARYFDACLSYEEIAEAIASEDTDRAKHRAALILRAVQQAKSTSILIPAPEVTDMWDRIYKIAKAEFPALNMKPPGDKGANSWWLIFKGNMPPGITIDWKLKNGFVDLSFWSSAPYIPTSSSALPPGASFLVSGKTTILRVPVQKPPQQWVELSDAKIREALKAALGLLDFHNSQTWSDATVSADGNHH